MSSEFGNTALVVGATGATGKLLVRQLLERQYNVRVIVRDSERLPQEVRDNPRVSIIEKPVLELTDEELHLSVNDCSAIASCLGHNLTLKGIYGKPRRLVTDATRRLCNAILKNKPPQPVRFVLMNTTGNRNRDLDEKVSTGHEIVVGLLRLLLPPHPDNEQAAEYLRTEIGHDNSYIQWVAVRPDGLVDEDKVTDYSLHPSPTRDPIFNAGKTSRINVAHFMAELITNGSWTDWRGQMPVIYNKSLS